MQLTKKLIDKYLQGKCTPEEVLFVENYLKDSEVMKNLFPKEEWDKIIAIQNQINSSELLSSIEERIESSRKNRTQKLIKITIAAALILLIPFGSILYHRYSVTELLVKSTPVENLTPPLSYLRHINSSNQNMLLLCSDSSIITLYPNSEIRYAETFEGMKERDIYLKGAAKFQVKKNPNQPFRVHSNGFITTALGTTFIVSETTAHKTKIELLEGKIEIKSTKNEGKKLHKQIQSSGTIVLNNQSSRILNEIKPSPSLKNREAYFVEEQDQLHFKNLAISNILHILEQNYRINIQVDTNKIINKYYSGSFKEEENVYKKIIKEINYLHKINISYTK